MFTFGVGWLRSTWQQLPLKNHKYAIQLWSWVQIISQLARVVIFVINFKKLSNCSKGHAFVPEIMKTSYTKIIKKNSPTISCSKSVLTCHPINFASFDCWQNKINFVVLVLVFKKEVLWCVSLSMFTYCTFYLFKLFNNNLLLYAYFIYFVP